MDDRVTDEDGRRARKIDVARRAARELVAQFATYASEHPDEPVSLGIFEFSRRENQADCRPIIPMGPPDLVEGRRGAGRGSIPKAARRSVRRWSPRSWRSTRPGCRAAIC